MATPKQSSAQLPAPATAGTKKGRGVKEKHVTDGAKTIARKHVDAEQETEGPSIAAFVSQTILEDIIDEAARQLYKRLLDRKCFSFAAYCTWRFVLSNVELCYIRCDPGDFSEDLQQRNQERAEHHQGHHRHRLHAGQQEHLKKEQEEGHQQEPQHVQHDQEEQRQRVQQPGHQQYVQTSPQLHQCHDNKQQRLNQSCASLWACEEMPQLAPLDNWAPGSLTVKSISPSTIPVPAGKKGKKAGSFSLTCKNAPAQSAKKAK